MRCSHRRMAAQYALYAIQVQPDPLHLDHTCCGPHTAKHLQNRSMHSCLGANENPAALVGGDEAATIAFARETFGHMHWQGVRSLHVPPRNTSPSHNNATARTRWIQADGGGCVSTP